MGSNREEDASKHEQTTQCHPIQCLYVPFFIIPAFLPPFSPHSPFISIISIPLRCSFLSLVTAGGQKYAASKEKLLQWKGSLFEQMLVSDHPQQLPSGERDVEVGEFLLNCNAFIIT